MKLRFEYLYDEKAKRRNIYVWEGMTLMTFTSMDGIKPTTKEEKAEFEKEYTKRMKNDSKGNK